ncbi:MAG TPA: hypothetical protein VN446_04040 [Candidatus Acidoferrum sp.]|nr:hypothetical protein [Candidatus Acidoferrum sp.]
MKKYLSVLLASVLAISMLAGCSPKTEPAGTTPEETPPVEEVATASTGLAVISSIAKSKDAGEKDGLAQVDSAIVAVTVDKDGKIVDCVIDAAQTKINFSAAGELVTPADTVFKTKNELGEEYGMKGASGIGKEWNEQAAAFADYVVGKTADEVKNIAIDEEGHATGSDLTASVTIGIDDYIEAVAKAVANANELGAAATDKLSLAVVTNMGKSANAGEKDGLAQAYSTYIAVTTDADGKITSCAIDASQSNVNFDATGKITTDLAAAVLRTKNELGEEYGMKGASGIGKEWNEQAAAFALYVTGKTAAEVEGIAIDEEGHATGSDLTASVTIGIDDFKAALAKALA